MIALDTNILVRLVTRDDPSQTQAVARLLESSPVYLSKTVLLETEWVLRYTYGLDRETIFETFERLMGLTNLSVEDMRGVTLSLQGYSQGLDFADALHLASSGEATKFVTFDQGLIKRAKRVTGFVRVESA